MVTQWKAMPGIRGHYTFDGNSSAMGKEGSTADKKICSLSHFDNNAMGIWQLIG